MHSPHIRHIKFNFNIIRIVINYPEFGNKIQLLFPKPTVTIFFSPFALHNAYTHTHPPFFGPLIIWFIFQPFFIQPGFIQHRFYGVKLMHKFFSYWKSDFINSKEMLLKRTSVYNSWGLVSISGSVCGCVWCVRSLFPSACSQPKPFHIKVIWKILYWNQKILIFFLVLWPKTWNLLSSLLFFLFGIVRVSVCESVFCVRFQPTSMLKRISRLTGKNFRFVIKVFRIRIKYI